MDPLPASSVQANTRAAGWLMLILVVCLLSLPAVAADSDEVAAMITSAETKQEEARRQRHAWSSTNDYIAEARALLDAGKVGPAEAAAQRALKAVNASLQQAADESTAWQARVPAQ